MTYNTSTYMNPEKIDRMLKVARPVLFAGSLMGGANGVSTANITEAIKPSNENPIVSLVKVAQAQSPCEVPYAFENKTSNPMRLVITRQGGNEVLFDKTLQPGQRGEDRFNTISNANKNNSPALTTMARINSDAPDTQTAICGGREGFSHVINPKSTLGGGSVQAGDGLTLPEFYRGIESGVKAFGSGIGIDNLLKWLKLVAVSSVGVFVVGSYIEGRRLTLRETFTGGAIIGTGIDLFF